MGSGLRPSHLQPVSGRAARWPEGGRGIGRSTGVAVTVITGFPAAFQRTEKTVLCVRGLQVPGEFTGLRTRERRGAWQG